MYFRLHFSDKLGGDDYIARSHGNCVMSRSVVAELPDLKEGTYSVVVKVIAQRDKNAKSVEDVVDEMCREDTDYYHEKFSQAGFSYNVAHSKGARVMEAHIKKRKAEEKRKAWKQRHEARKRNGPKSTTKRKMNKAALTIPVDPVDDKIKAIENASTSKQPDSTATIPAVLVVSSSAGIPSTPHIESAGRHMLQMPGEMPSSTIHTNSEERKSTQNQATQTDECLQKQDTENSDQEEVSSEYHTDTDSVNTFASGDEYRRLSYDPPYDSDDNNDNNDPWNAVCVVGLRVYSKDPNLRIEVIMPGQGEKPGLDIDDKQAGVPMEWKQGNSTELPIRTEVSKE